MAQSDRPPLFVTRAYLPPQEEFLRHVDSIFAARSLTNQGELTRELERRLAEFLAIPHVLSCANGTLALMMGLRLAALNGKKVITTPFTYVATLSAIMWEGCIPVFADIDPDSLCLSPAALRECLKKHPDAAAVLPVHIFGNACDVHAIEAICAEHGIICLYDACHAFGTVYEGRSLLDYGDYAVCSFHATKFFQTAEGGCLVVHDEESARQASLLRAFGHIGDEHYTLGFNAKLSELHAAMGLANMPHIAEIIAARREVCRRYDELLPLEHLARPVLRQGLEYNYAYYPVIFASEQALLAVMQALNAENVYPRRYFYPCLTELPYLPEPARSAACPVAASVSRRILCLPLHDSLSEEEIRLVAETIRRCVAKANAVPGAKKTNSGLRPQNTCG